MPLISEYYGINPSGGLPFFDLHVEKDTLCFLDPHIIRLQSAVDPYARYGRRLMDGYATEVFGGITSTNPHERQKAKGLLTSFSEVKFTRQGYTKNGYNGHGFEEGIGSRIYDTLSNEASSLVVSEKLSRLEELGAIIPGISNDRISDLTTSIVMDALIHFTEKMIDEFPEFSSNGHALTHEELRIWDADLHAWSRKKVRLPEASGGPLLLIPRLWVSKRLEFNPNRYYSVAVLDRIQYEQTSVLDDGKTLTPTKDLLRKQVGRSVESNLAVTKRAAAQNDDMLSQYTEFVDSKIPDREVQWSKMWYPKCR